MDKGYDVHGLVRRSSSYNTSRIEHLVTNKNLHLHYCDLTDSVNLIRLIKEIEPDEIYNLGAQSHVKISWDCPEFTAETDALGTLRLLEAIRINGLEKKTRFIKRQRLNCSDLFRNRYNLKNTVLSSLSLWCG